MMDIISSSHTTTFPLEPKELHWTNREICVHSSNMSQYHCCSDCEKNSGHIMDQIWVGLDV